MSDNTTSKRVVIVGGGFGGLSVAKQLAGHQHVEITIVDKQTVHTFQPLLYQVATASLSSGDIVEPIRTVFRGKKNVTTLQGDVIGVDRAAQKVNVKSDEGEFALPYDYLVLAPGMKNAYFNHPEWEAQAPGLKSVSDALRLRSWLLQRFEYAELPGVSEAERKRLLTFVVIGGGPTGVEMSGALADLARTSLQKEFRAFDPASVRVVLLEGGDHLLPQFPPAVGKAARDRLASHGVEVRTGSLVAEINEHIVKLKDGTTFDAGTVIWAAGVRVGDLGKWLGEPIDKAGRVTVKDDCSLPSANNIYVIGDAARMLDHGEPLPGLAPVALQQGHYVANVILKRAEGAHPPGPFSYLDKGNLAVVGRNFAVGAFKKITFTGFFAWILWGAVHLSFLVTFRNRILVLMQWAWVYLTGRRSSRVLLPHEVALQAAEKASHTPPPHKEGEPRQDVVNTPLADRGRQDIASGPRPS